MWLIIITGNCSLSNTDSSCDSAGTSWWSTSTTSVWMPAARWVSSSCAADGISRTVCVAMPQRAAICEMLSEKLLSALMTNRRSEEHTSELQSRENLVCRLLLEKKK